MWEEKDKNWKDESKKRERSAGDKEREMKDEERERKKDERKSCDYYVLWLREEGGLTNPAVTHTHTHLETDRKQFDKKKLILETIRG